MRHDLFMGDLHPDDPPASNPDAWDRDLTTDEVIDKITRQLHDGEGDGDELTIIVATRA